MCRYKVEFDATELSNPPEEHVQAGLLTVTVIDQDLELAEGDTDQERAVDAALDILYETPSFDWLSDYEVGEMDALSITEIDSAEA